MKNQMNPLQLISLAIASIALTAHSASTFQDLNTLPQLGCKIPAYLGTSSPAGAPSGKGGTDVAPSHAGPVIKGRAIWIKTPPEDSINTVDLAVAIPAVSNTIYGQARVETPSGFIWSTSTHMKISVVKGNLVPTLNSNTVLTGEEIVSSTYPIIASQNVLTAALAGMIERAVANGDKWTVVVQESRNAPYPTTSSPNWSQISTACELNVLQ
jgi:hypothetical protein